MDGDRGDDVYQQSLEVFFENHDPSTLNRRRPDVCTLCPSVVLFRDHEQEELARAEKERRDR